MKPLFVTAMTLGMIVAPLPALAATVIAPGGAGNAQGPAPFTYFGTTGSRVQQVFASSFFSGPISLTSVSFRAYPGASPSFFFGNTLNVSNVAINLSTTAFGDETGTMLSSVFANNIGANVASVYQGALTLSTAATGTGPQPFDYTVNFQNPFLYDPSQGNLLLDVNVLGSTSGTGFGFVTFDTANTLNDGVFSVVDIFNGAATTGTQSTAGAIAQFGGHLAAPVPEPATWAMMIAGFALAGVGLRRRGYSMKVALRA